MQGCRTFRILVAWSWSLHLSVRVPGSKSEVSEVLESKSEFSPEVHKCRLGKIKWSKYNTVYEIHFLGNPITPEKAD